MKASEQHQVDVAPIVETDSVATVKSFIEQGFACTVTIRNLFSREEQLGQVIVLDLNRPALRTSVALCIPASSNLRLEDEFVSLVADRVSAALSR